MAEPGQAAPSDIIALYLKGRDVPCPACNYNRRDDTTPACPECGHHLRLRPIARNSLELNPKTCYWLAGTLITLAAIFIPIQTYEVVRSFTPGTSRLQGWTIPEIAMILGFLTAGIFAILTILRVRRRHPRAAQSATAAVAALLAGLILPIGSLLTTLL